MSTTINTANAVKSYPTSSYSGSYNSGYYGYNSYPSTKKNHEFDSVLPESFKDILKMKQENLKQFLYEMLKEKGYNPIFRDGFIFAKGETPVMLVAHMDTVHKSEVKEIYVSDCGNITSPQGIGGDDRCGIFMITQLLQYKPYVLFTEDEEIGGVGAKKFAAAYEKKEIEEINVKYLIELDRKGCNDMVFYDCDNSEFETYIGSFGWDCRWGTYSDISTIAPVIGVAAVNLSSGYYKAHTTEEIINIDDVTTNIKRVRKLVTASNKDEVPVFKYVRSLYGGYYNYGKQYGTAAKTIETTSTPKVTMMDGTPITPVKKGDNAETKTKTPFMTFGNYCDRHGLDITTDEGWKKAKIKYDEYVKMYNQYFNKPTYLEQTMKKITDFSEPETKTEHDTKPVEIETVAETSNNTIISWIKNCFTKQKA